MQITYSNTIDDLVAFNHYLAEHSSTIQGNMRMVQRIWAASPVLGVILFSMYKGYPVTSSVISAVVIGLLISLPVYVLYPQYCRWYREKTVRKIYSEGENKSVLGEHNLQIVPEGIRGSSAFDENKFGWESIEKIASTDEYTYIFTGATAAIVLPQKAIISGNYEEFVRMVSTKQAQGNKEE